MWHPQHGAAAIMAHDKKKRETAVTSQGRGMPHWGQFSPYAPPYAQLRGEVQIQQAAIPRTTPRINPQTIVWKKDRSCDHSPNRHGWQTKILCTYHQMIAALCTVTVLLAGFYLSERQQVLEEALQAFVQSMHVFDGRTIAVTSPSKLP